MIDEARYFDSRSALSAAMDFGTGRRKSRPPLPAKQELSAQRAQAIVSGCVYRKGPTGWTVFDFRCV